MIRGDGAEYAGSIQPGHHQVQQHDQRLGGCAQSAQRGETVRDLVYLISNIFERKSHCFSNGIVVVNDEHSRSRSHARSHILALETLHALAGTGIRLHCNELRTEDTNSGAATRYTRRVARGAQVDTCAITNGRSHHADGVPQMAYLRCDAVVTRRYLTSDSSESRLFVR